jgi:hypothetical protein
MLTTFGQLSGKPYSWLLQINNECLLLERLCWEAEGLGTKIFPFWKKALDMTVAIIPHSLHSPGSMLGTTRTGHKSEITVHVTQVSC